MANEVLIKQERNAWAVLLKALSEAYTNGVNHFVDATANGFDLDALNKAMTLNTRINESFSGHTPIAPYSNGITDLYVSPEVLEKVRGFAYNPIYTSVKTDVLPDNIREDIYRQAGMASIYGVNLNEMVELGAGKKYLSLFEAVAPATEGANASTDMFSLLNISNHADDAAGDNWGVGTQDLAIGVDNTRGAFIRPVARQWDSGGDGTFRALPDEQFNMYGSRVEKTGFYGFLEEGRICIDARAIMGIIL
jgi:hypothetical protein